MDCEPEGKVRSRGRGTLFRQKGSRFFWLQYYIGGRRIRESSHTAHRPTAVKLLNEKIAAIDAGRLAPNVDRTTFEDLAEILIAEYQANDRRSLRRIEQALTHLRGFFGGHKAKDIMADSINRYIAMRRAEPHRQGTGASNGTINRELTALRRAMTLAVRSRKLATRPEFELLEENNARQGFLERGEMEAICEELPDYFKPALRVAYLTGWRAEEILSRQWSHVDFENGWMRLEPGQTKNRQGREFPMLPELRAVLEGQRASAGQIETTSEVRVPWVFHYSNGDRIGQYRNAWSKACKRAGLEGKLLHDCRRTAVRNLERFGVPRSTAMAITGHKTENIYRRYAIVDAGSMREAAVKLAAGHAAENRAHPMTHGEIERMAKKAEAR
jgi:integrase